ncbi:MAG: acetate--CoA ligase family protein [Burkholderiaceae bacterium]
MNTMPERLDEQATARLAALGSVFAPRSIAIVGASDTVSKIGGLPVDFLKRFGFDGPIYPVNPKGGTVQDLAAYPSLSAIGAPVDVAVFAVPANRVGPALDDAIAAGVRGVVLFTSGYAEVSEQGADAQRGLATTCRQAGVRLLGPNCLGFINVRSGVYATFAQAPRAGTLRAGGIGLVSQSGAFGAYAYVLALQRQIGFSHWITTGNEADLDFADCVEWLAHDPHTRVIMGYMEGCRDGFKLRRALAAAHSARKPVVIVKVGRTAIGARAAASHTAALAGDDAIYDAIFREYGVHRAHDVDEFFGVAASASIATLPPDRSIGLFTVSGGVGVLMADQASDSGLDVRPMPEAAQAQIRDWIPFAAPANPVDITGQVTNDLTLIERSARLMLDQGRYGSWVGFLAAAGASDAFWPVAESLARNLRRDYPDKLLALCTLLSPERRRTVEEMGCLVFSEPVQAIRTLAALTGFTEAFARSDVAPPRAADMTRPLPPGVQSEPRALATLAAAGIATNAHQLVSSAAQAVAATGRFAQPVVLKIVSPDLLHKSDIGGVALGLDNDAAVQGAYQAMHEAVRRHAPDASIDGVLVAPMVTGGVECLLGAKHDPVFGPIVLFGLGGVLVETIGDVALHSAPLDRAQALAMIRSVKGFALLSGARGRPPVDLDCLADNLVALSRLAVAAGDSLASIDINPFIALPADRGGGCALDAVIIGRQPDQESDT